MKISEQAKQAAAECDESAFVSDDAKIIQRAINEHERDLVEAARELFNLEECSSLNLDALKAALDRRKE